MNRKESARGPTSGRQPAGKPRAGPSASRAGAGPRAGTAPSASRAGAGPSASRAGAGPSASRAGAGPSASRAGAGPSASRAGPGPCKEPTGGRQPQPPAGKPPGTCKGPSGSAGSRPPAPKPKVPDRDAFPAFSIPIPPPTTREQFKAKQKIIRRNKPAGEDLNKLREIVKSVRKKPTTVHEFLGLVAPSTGDNGNALRSVLAEEMSLFQTTSRKIFETMSQDISDVLVNEQIQLKEYTLERHALYEQKMQRALNEVLDHCPEFSFEQFFTNDDYLDEQFPLEELNIDQEELEALLRQEAYHRYHWLKSEGDRLKDENGRLQKRLRELKKRQKDELHAVTEKEQRAEDQRKLLEATQEVLEDRLEELNESVNKSLVESELAQADPISLQPLPSPQKISERIKARGSVKMKAEWASKQAAEIEAIKANEDRNAESSMAAVRAKPSKSKMGARSRFRRPPPRPAAQAPAAGARPPSPFHYSPPRSPPTKDSSARPPSPFHFSPPRSPPPSTSAQDRGAEAPAATKMNLSTSRVLTERQPTPGPSGRYRAPRDTWGGFG